MSIVNFFSYDLSLTKDKRVKLVRENKFTSDKDFTNPMSIFDWCNKELQLNTKAEEHVYCIATNTKSRPLGVFFLSKGIVNASIVNPREIYVRALLLGATHIFVIHNHPSGDTTPSQEDKLVCNRLKEAGKLIGLTLLDFLIIGDTYFSFKEKQYL